MTLIPDTVSFPMHFHYEQFANADTGSKNNLETR
jgi:hypothetical protein